MDPFVAEIYVMANNFAPTGFAFCNGQIMPLSQNTALFSLLGTVYGGDGKSTFALPNLQSTAPMFWGQGQGLSQRTLGETGGAEYVTLLQSEMPMHTHNATASAAAGFPPSTDPTNNFWAGTNERPYLPTTGGTLQAMSPTALAISGGSLPHNNLMPYLMLNFIIALQGVFPPRS